MKSHFAGDRCTKGLFGIKNTVIEQRMIRDEFLATEK